MGFALRAFAAENGLFLTVQVVVAGLFRRIHNWAIRRALPGSPTVHLHPSAFLRGLSHMRIGENFRAGRNLWLEAVTEQNGRIYSPRIVIGANVTMNDDVHIGATNEVHIGNDVLIASRVFISDHLHGNYRGNSASDPLTPPRLREVSGTMTVRIEDNVWIGEMVSILPGTTIGRGSVIGSNSVVTRDIPAGVIAAGCPARVIKTYNPENQTWIEV